MQKASAFVPGHISGFFQICDGPPEPERKGSRGAGPNLNLGVRTEVAVEPSDSPGIEITINGRAAPEAQTTKAVITQIMRMVPEPMRVVVKHISQVPIGAGYGASGAGALGTALALNEALNLNLERDQITTLAHVAEVMCDTGRGDVVPQTLGGLVISREPGVPTYGDWSRIQVPDEVRVVCGTLGPLPTRGVLKDRGLLERSEKFGGSALKALVKNPTHQEFMRVSREFAEGLGLLDDELRALIKAAVKAGAIGASQVMLGRAVFALAKNNKIGAVKRAFLELLESSAVMATEVSGRGARLLLSGTLVHDF